jgi:isocitrate/isopropylmalate dehydrogenase
MQIRMANPCWAIVFAGQLAERLGKNAAAARIRAALQTHLEAGAHTADMGVDASWRWCARRS